ncbi:MAG: ligC 1 [Bryobacterales bacterium]|nr:ligC 1 [Bryobacterales bacterium]
MRIAIVGCGAVAAIHASRLRAAGTPMVGICGSSLGKAQAFAAAHGIERAAADLDAALMDADAAIVASPSEAHFGQAMRALERRAHVLVELPPCASTAQAETLGRIAAGARRILQCAHTSRYLEPYRRVRRWIQEGRFGEIRQVHYVRGVVPSRRSWTDDALLHHAAHPIDLLLDWFGGLEPVAGVALPCGGPGRDISLLAQLPNGAPATIAISYSSKLPHGQLTVIGERHTLITDGFSSMESDDPSLNWRGDATATYEQAVADQDLAFLACCETLVGGVPWEETVRMARHVEAFQELCKI